MVENHKYKVSIIWSEGDSYWTIRVFESQKTRVFPWDYVAMRENKKNELEARTKGIIRKKGSARKKETKSEENEERSTRRSR